MSDEPALLAAILADPADDTVRLAYADWCDEHEAQVKCPECHGSGCVCEPIKPLVVQERQLPNGRIERFEVLPPFSFRRPPPCPRCERRTTVSNGFAVRAEFIRVQVALEPLRGVTVLDAARVQKLLDRETELLATKQGARKNGYIWAEPAFNLHEIQFRRGFVEHVACSADDWVRQGDAIYAAHPIHSVRLTALVDGGLLIGRNMLVQIVGGVNEWKAVICYPDEGCGQDRWPGITFELPRANLFAGLTAAGQTMGAAFAPLAAAIEQFGLAVSTQFASELTGLPQPTGDET